MYASFKPFYAQYWHADPNTLYKVMKFSRSGQNVYLAGKGMAPIDIMEFSDIVEFSDDASYQPRHAKGYPCSANVNHE